MTSVWPALWPPWKRTTPWAWSVIQSTILPLPSSPHWVPTTTTLRPGRMAVCMGFSGMSGNGAQRRAAGRRHELAVALEGLRLALVPGQHREHGLARLAQLADG